MKISASHLQGKNSVTVFTAIFLRIQVFWNVTLCSWLRGSKVFEGVLRSLGPLKIKALLASNFGKDKHSDTA